MSLREFTFEEHLGQHKDDMDIIPPPTWQALKDYIGEGKMDRGTGGKLSYILAQGRENTCSKNQHKPAHLGHRGGSTRRSLRGLGSNLCSGPNLAQSTLEVPQRSCHGAVSPPHLL